jgi:hypothetical protein
MNDNLNVASCASQCDKIKAWLEEGRCITSWDAIMMWGCTRLASRIWDLRERGLNIKKRRKVCASGKIVAEYYL